ncbi:efflux RND transporter periplasmic adaptor subunit [Chroococcidiopsis sp. FACHB-1243]|uniref:efflux RND transporter periplasmic adaptor subunit n=1 Tax=Chroococcidiopsis sp. [FACHB-1243] TaxID=2692781 RepID=UPI0017817327|nr:efflux RND transporter periplasmic adaptor subunit [Chroococcidiopsis sp. [FACHB-1243]]MBD2307583.1 efflux RND transporter periplasmic adaptor subunit [Chroococcidiopsis sp. [FACHB-1243]]
MLLFGKNPLNQYQQNSSQDNSDRLIFNWFKDIGLRESLLLSIYAFGLTTVIYLTCQNNQPSFASSSVVKQDIPVGKLEFTGTVYPAKRMKISTSTAAVVKEIYVDIGDRIQPGQPILKLENLASWQKLDRLKKEQFQSNLELEKAQQKHENAAQKTVQLQLKTAIVNRKIGAIEQLFDTESRLSKAELTLQLWQQQQDIVQKAKGIYLRAAMQHDRLKKLASQGAVSSSEVERSQAKLATAKTNLVKAETGAILQEIEQQQRRQWQLRKQLTLLEHQQQLAAIEGQIQLARSQSRQATQRLNLLHQQRSLLPKESDLTGSFPVTAKAAGVVVNLPVVVGDRIYAGRDLVELAQLKSLKVRVSVSTSLINTLRLGQRAVVQLGKAASAQQIEATVVTISPIPEQDRTHIVEVQFQNPQENLLVGQAAKVRFVAEE